MPVDPFGSDAAAPLEVANALEMISESLLCTSCGMRLISPSRRCDHDAQLDQVLQRGPLAVWSSWQREVALRSAVHALSHGLEYDGPATLLFLLQLAGDEAERRARVHGS